MKRGYRRFLVIGAGMLFALAACARLQPQVALGPEPGEKTVAIQASDFKFEPNNIKAYRGDTIVFKIENITNTGHNFTMKDPRGQKIQNMDIPPKKTVEVKISFPETGEYDFYCDEPFHAFLGMKGQIQVVER